MQQVKHILAAFVLIGGCGPQSGFSETMTLIRSSGESVELNIDREDHFLTVLDQVQSYFDGTDLQENADGLPLSPSRLEFSISHAGMTVRSKTKEWRKYENAVTKDEKKDVRFIIKTLANDSLISIGTSSRSSLKEAGVRVDHLHPFRWLLTIFTDEELKAGAHAIRDRGGLVWGGFTDGTVGSLKEEFGRGNLLQYVPDFAKKLQIDPKLILPSLENKKWMEFIHILIDKVPREIDPNRYDM